MYVIVMYVGGRLGREGKARECMYVGGGEV